MDLETKLAILSDAAKYDASCASSGAPKRSAAPGKGMGSTTTDHSKVMVIREICAAL